VKIANAQGLAQAAIAHRSTKLKVPKKNKGLWFSKSLPLKSHKKITPHIALR
jgi:hypothetical protein